MNNIYLDNLKNYRDNLGELSVLGEYINKEESFYEVANDIMVVCESVNSTQKTMKIIEEKQTDKGKQLITLIEETEYEKVANDIVGILEKYETVNKKGLFTDLINLVKLLYKNSMDIHEGLTVRTDSEGRLNSTVAQVQTVYFLGEVDWTAYELYLPKYLETYFNK